MHTRELTQWLAAMLEVEMEDADRRTDSLPDRLSDRIERVQEFRDVGIFASSDGLVIRTRTGEEFQVTVVQTRYVGRQPPAAAIRRAS